MKLNQTNLHYKMLNIYYLLKSNFNNWVKIPNADAETREIIKQLRLSGNVIIAGPKGYMLTDNVELASKYISSRWAELTKEMKPLKAMSLTLGTQDLLKIGE